MVVIQKHICCLGLPVKIFEIPTTPESVSSLSFKYLFLQRETRREERRRTRRCPGGVWDRVWKRWLSVKVRRNLQERPQMIEPRCTWHWHHNVTPASARLPIPLGRQVWKRLGHHDEWVSDYKTAEDPEGVVNSAGPLCPLCSSLPWKVLTSKYLPHPSHLGRKLKIKHSLETRARCAQG